MYVQRILYGQLTSDDRTAAHKLLQHLWGHSDATLPQWQRMLARALFPVLRAFMCKVRSRHRVIAIVTRCLFLCLNLLVRSTRAIAYSTHGATAPRHVDLPRKGRGGCVRQHAQGTE